MATPVPTHPLRQFRPFFVLSLAAVLIQGHAATVSWKSAVDGSWNDATKWSTGKVPEANDAVVIDLPGTYQVSLTSPSATIASLTVGNATGAQTLVIGNGGGLAVAGAGSITNKGSLHLAPGGLIDGTGVVTIYGGFDWLGGGMSGTGKTAFASGSTIRVLNGDNKTIRERTIENASTVAWSTTQILSVGNGTVWDNLPGSILDLQSDTSIQFWFGSGGTFNNHGTIQKSGGTGNSVLGYTLQNSGIVQAKTGTLYLAAGGTAGGSWIADTGATLLFATGTYANAAGTAFSGAGKFILGSGGIYQVTQPQVIATSFELAAGGLISGPGNLGFTGAFTWSGGGMQDAGKTVFGAGSVVQIRDGDNKTVRERTLDNATAITWNTSQVLSVGGGTVWNNLPGASIDFKSDCSIQFWFGAGGTLNNQGTIRKTGGIGNTVIGYVLNNSGSIQSDSGTLYFAAGGALAAQWIASANASIQFATGTYQNAAGVSLGGAGRFILGSGGILSVAVPQSINPTFELAPGGLIAGPSELQFNGRFIWSGGGMQDAGVTTFAPSSTVIVQNGDNKTLRERTLNNSATVSWGTPQVLSVGGGTVWNNLPGSVLDFQTDTSIQYWFGAGGTLNNQGRIVKSGGVGNTVVGYAVVNANEIQSASGTLYFAGGATLGSVWNTSASANIVFATGTYQNTATTSFTGAGNFILTSGGILNVTPPLTITPALELAPGGLIAGTGSLTVAGPFTWSGGGMQDAGTTTFAGSSTITVKNGDNKTLRERTINNASTVQWNTAQVLSVGGGSVWNNAAGSVLDFQSDTSIQYWFGAGGTLNNLGTVIKTGGTGNTVLGFIVNNSATIQCNTGSLYFSGGATVAANWIATAPGTITFATGIYQNAVGANISGTGNFIIASGATYRAAVPQSIPIATELAPGGLISGESELTWTGPFNWSGGGMEAVGKTTFSPTSTLTVKNGDNKTLRERTLTTAGPVLWNSTQVLSVGGGATWNHLSTATLDFQTDFSIQYWFGAASAFNNEGTLRKSGGNNTSIFGFGLNNKGVCRLESGRTAFTQSVVQTAGSFTLAGGHADGPAHFNFLDGTLEGAGDINANVGVAGAVQPGLPLGRLNIGGEYTNGPSATTTLLLSGTEAGVNHDQIRAGTALKLAGDLIVQFGPGYEPTAADAWVLLAGASRTGTFASTNAPDGFAPELTYTSTNVTLRLIRSAVTAPVITEEPIDVTVLNNAAVTFSVKATGASLNYQWRRNGVNISGANGASYSIPSARFRDAGEYSVVVANGGGSKTSRNAVLTVNPSNLDAGLIARYPLDGTLQDVVGSQHGKTNGTLTYVSNGARGQGLRFDGGSWVTLGSNPAGNFTDSTDLLSVSFWIRPRSAIPMVPIHINTPAGDFAVYISSGVAGDFPTHFGFRGQTWVATGDPRAFASTNLGCWTQFTISYSGGAKDSPSSYRAYVNGIAVDVTQTIPGGALAGLSELGRNINGVNAYVFGDLDEVRIYERALRAEDAVQLASNPPDSPPELLTHPASLTVPLGAPFSLASTAIGAQPLHFQWFRNGIALDNGTNALYARNAASVDDQGTYYLVVSNRFGSLQSSNALVNVTIPPPPGFSGFNLGIPNTISSVSFLNPNYGFIAFRSFPGGPGGGVCFTTNGGATWTVSNTGVTNDVNAIQLVGAVAYIAGNNGLLCISTNNGAAWRPFITGTSETFYGVSFANPTSGWAVGSGGTICYYNGISWTPTFTGVGVSFYSITYAGEIPWVAGANGTICRYINGAWQPVPTGINATFYGIAFASPNRGLAVGSGGTICRWNGTAWIGVNSGTTSNIRTVAWADDNTAYITGDNGLLCITRDGGLTWEPLSSGGTAGLGGLAISGGRAFVFGTGGTGLTFTVPAQVPNLPPTIVINTPTNTQQFYACTRIPITAIAGDPDGTVAKVEFFRGQYKLAEFTRPPRGGRPFATSFRTDAFGFYELRAVATDNLGAVTISEPVTIEVIPPPADIIIPEEFTEEGMALCFLGEEGAQYVLQGALEIEAPIPWVNLSTNTMPKLLLRVVDPDAVNHPYRYYRFQKQP